MSSVQTQVRGSQLSATALYLYLITVISCSVVLTHCQTLLAMPSTLSLCACGPYKSEGKWLLPLPHTFCGTLKERDAVLKVEKGLARRGPDGDIYCDECNKPILGYCALDIWDSKFGRGFSEPWQSDREQ